jgi:predicted transcriptional regulator
MSVNKKRDLEFIKAFNKITLTEICKDLNIDKSNVYRGVASAKNIKLVKDEIIKRFDEIKKD